MNKTSRRNFLKTASIITVGGALVQNELLSAPILLLNKRIKQSAQKGELLFKPYFVQSGKGPHLGMVKSIKDLGEKDWDFPSWAFASDTEWDAFNSNIFTDNDGVKISNAEGKDKFGINVRWNVEGFGYIYMTADNAGEFYSLPEKGKNQVFNLNYELAKSKLNKINSRYKKFENDNWIPSREVSAYIDLARNYFNDAEQNKNNNDRCAIFCQKALQYGMWAGEMMELDKARADIKKGGRKNFFIGCDTKGYPHMDTDMFLDLFTNVFNYATITHYLPSFEKEESKYIFERRDEQFKKLRARNVTVEGRPVFWADECCSPDWLLKKSYPELLKYVEQHTRDLYAHYGDEMYAWEIINEAHDWGNALHLKPDQMVEIAKLACEAAKDTNPKVHRLVNNCCIQADYIQLKQWEEKEERFQLITPHQYIKMLHEAGVDFTITGQQLYHPYTNRDMQDVIMMTERLEKYGRPVQITELGVTSGPTKDTVISGKYEIPDHPYDWHGPWTEDLQADWLEQIYTIFYSKPWVEAINWYDFVDPYSFVQNGGLLKSARGEKKAAYERLAKLKKQWNEI